MRRCRLADPDGAAPPHLGRARRACAIAVVIACCAKPSCPRQLREVLTRCPAPVRDTLRPPWYRATWGLPAPSAGGLAVALGGASLSNHGPSGACACPRLSAIGVA
eukprot:15435319-Alexandrium_andersonii.AAC.1